jgi:class 3 adenylate cyclase
MGIGIASGEAILGNIGSPHYMSHTIIGDAVNIAARLVQAAKPREVLVSGSVHEAIRELLPRDAAVSHDRVALRGKTGTTDVYSIRL